MVASLPDAHAVHFAAGPRRGRAEDGRAVGRVARRVFGPLSRTPSEVPGCRKPARAFGHGAETNRGARSLPLGARVARPLLLKRARRSELRWGGCGTTRTALSRHGQDGACKARPKLRFRFRPAQPDSTRRRGACSNSSVTLYVARAACTRGTLLGLQRDGEHPRRWRAPARRLALAVTPPAAEP